MEFPKLEHPLIIKHLHLFVGAFLIGVRNSIETAIFVLAFVSRGMLRSKDRAEEAAEAFEGAATAGALVPD